MFNAPGYAVYLSNYKQIREQLSSIYEEGCHVFTSFHISEEFTEDYPKRMENMCGELRGMGYRIMGDVSQKTLRVFSCKTIADFAQRMGLSAVRIDYGFTEEEIIAAGKQMRIAMNASTLDKKTAERIAESVPEVYAVHNFYPRPETGLDEELFQTINEGLRECGVKILAFIPGDAGSRGPLHLGLPTLESHRGKMPYGAYVDLKKRFHMDGVFVGDGVLSEGEAKRIKMWEEEKVLGLPIELTLQAQKLYGKTFTVRADSPGLLKRFQESREYSCFGQEIKPAECGERQAGSLTMDNERYLRYSGEIQLLLKDLPQDERVNVIGHLCKGYEPLLQNVNNSDKVKIIPKR